MDRYVRSIFTSYEEEITELDSQQWEQDLPSTAGFQSDRRTRLKSEMIDVDLVRGSTFPKAKRSRGMLKVVLQSLISALLFPLQYRWWRNKSSSSVFNLGCVVYVMTLVNCWVYLNLTKEGGKTEFSELDIVSPIILFVSLIFFKLYVHASRGQDKQKTLFTTINMKSRKMNSKEELFNWDAARKGTFKEFEGLISAEANSDNESMNGHVCSDCDHIDDRNGNCSEFEESEKESLLSDSDLLEKPSPRKMSKEKLKQAFRSKRDDSRDSTRSKAHADSVLKIGCTVWNNNDPYKLKLSALEIGVAIFEKSADLPESSVHAVVGVVFAFILALLPAACRPHLVMETVQNLANWSIREEVFLLVHQLNGNSMTDAVQNWTAKIDPDKIIMFNLVVVRLILFSGFFFLLSVTERIYRKKFVIAKLFSHITSSRRSARSKIPHFRLYKVRNIKVWLCVRSMLRKLGPKRSIDLIVSVSCLITLVSILYICHQMLKEEEDLPLFKMILINLEVILLCVFVGYFLLRFIILSNSINKKFWNPSVLLTEQINIYLRLEEKPHKKEPLVLANNVLKLTSDLIKELERPYNILGIGSNPLFYNLLKILSLSAASGILSEILGFKMKLYKVKL